MVFHFFIFFFHFFLIDLSNLFDKEGGGGGGGGGILNLKSLICRFNVTCGVPENYMYN